jgi:hypothetical protein
MMKLSTKHIATTLLLAVVLACSANTATARFDDDPDDDGGGGGGGGTVPAGPPVYQFPETGFTWWAPNRVDGWQAAWAEYGSYKSWGEDRYNPAYVNPSSWELFFQGCQTDADFRYDLDNTKGKGPNQYRWTWNKQSQDWSSDCYTSLDFPAQGTYYVKLEWRPSNNINQVHTIMLPVRVKDYLIVQLGDSMASGEGAPDVPIHVWDTTANADWVDDRCHRSKNAGGPVAAKALENADPHSSVTFLSFACSGATLTREQYNGYFPFDPYFVTDYASKGVGITDGFVGIEPPMDSTGNFANLLPAQTQQLFDAVSNNGSQDPRVVDVLMATGGINDVRFAALVANCMFGPDLITPCQYELVGPTQTPLDAQFEIDRQDVIPGWKKMKQQLQQLGVVSKKRLAIEYPPLFHDDEGDPCVLLFWDILPPNTWNILEAAHANDVWAANLNQSVKTGAMVNEHGNPFEWVGGIASDFNTHGMCADKNWFNTPTESAHRQGDDEGNPGDLAITSTTGLAHPNPEGYEHIAARILEHTGNVGYNEKPVGVGDKVIAGKNMYNYFEVLSNDSDPDGDPLTTRKLSEPLHGHVTIKPDGRVSYKPNQNYVGTDIFVYELTDGEYAIPVFVTITVQEPVKIEVQMGPLEYQEISGLGGIYNLEGPFEIIFDKVPRPSRGEISVEDKHAGTINISTTARRWGRMKVPYVIYDRTTNVTSPTYGTVVRGVLTVRVKP